MEDQHRRWSADMPDAYDRLLVPAVFEPFAADLAARVGSRSPSRVLEVAAGTGIVTRALVGLPGVGEVVATDLNPSMVGVGRERVPSARWHSADALALPFAAETFDAVVCQFGVMFFPDKVTGMAEARRVLTADGTFHANTWDRLETHGLQAAFTAALRAVLPEDPPDFIAAVPHGYADPGQLAEDARSAGFSTATVETVTLHTRPVSAYDAAVGYCTGTPVRAALERRGDLAQLTTAIAQETERILGGDPVTAQMTAHVLTALG